MGWRFCPEGVHSVSVASVCQIQLAWILSDVCTAVPGFAPHRHCYFIFVVQVCIMVVQSFCGSHTRPHANKSDIGIVVSCMQYPREATYQVAVHA